MNAKADQPTPTTQRKTSTREKGATVSTETEAPRPTMVRLAMKDGSWIPDTAPPAPKTLRLVVKKNCWITDGRTAYSGLHAGDVFEATEEEARRHLGYTAELAPEAPTLVQTAGEAKPRRIRLKPEPVRVSIEWQEDTAVGGDFWTLYQRVKNQGGTSADVDALNAEFSEGARFEDDPPTAREQVLAVIDEVYKDPDMPDAAQRLELLRWNLTPASAPDEHSPAVWRTTTWINQKRDGAIHGLGAARNNLSIRRENEAAKKRHEGQAGAPRARRSSLGGTGTWPPEGALPEPDDAA